jgi:hypothetical protein
MCPGSRREGAFSRRERVGWLIRSAPVSEEPPAGQLEGRIKPQGIEIVEPGA